MRHAYLTYRINPEGWAYFLYHIPRQACITIIRLARRVIFQQKPAQFWYMEAPRPLDLSMGTAPIKGAVLPFAPAFLIVSSQTVSI